MATLPMHPQGADIAMNYTAEDAVTQWRFVKAGTSDAYVKAIAAANEQVLGVAMDDASADERVDVVVFGVTVVEAGGAISVGDIIAADAQGRAVAVTVGTTTHDKRAAGKALTSASAAGELVAIVLASNPLATV